MAFLFLAVLLSGMVGAYLHKTPSAWPHHILYWFALHVPGAACIADTNAHRALTAALCVGVPALVGAVLLGDALARYQRRIVARQNAREARLIAEERDVLERRARVRHGTPALVAALRQPPVRHTPDWPMVAAVGLFFLGCAALVAVLLSR